MKTIFKNSLEIVDEQSIQMTEPDETRDRKAYYREKFEGDEIRAQEIALEEAEQKTEDE